jgi:hypothetical protein
MLLFSESRVILGAETPARGSDFGIRPTRFPIRVSPRVCFHKHPDVGQPPRATIRIRVSTSRNAVSHTAPRSISRARARREPAETDPPPIVFPAPAYCSTESTTQRLPANQISFRSPNDLGGLPTRIAGAGTTRRTSRARRSTRGNCTVWGRELARCVQTGGRRPLTHCHSLSGHDMV